MITAAELCAELVRIPTDEPQATAPALALCEEVLLAAGFRLRRWVETLPGVASALYEREGDGPALLIDGHLDTVPPGDAAKWERDPLGGEITEGAVWGRGSADDKGPIAAALIALQGYAGARRLLVSLGGDEELHMRGVQLLMEDEAMRQATQAIVLEPTALAPVHAHKGNARLRLDVQGRPAHASRPWQGVNVIEEKIRLIQAMRDWFAINEGARRVAAFADEPGTLVVTREETPNATFNVIPDRGSFWYNLRWLPDGDDPLEAVVEQVMKKAERLHISAEVEVEYSSPSLLTSADAPLVRALARVGGKAPAWVAYGTHGGHLKRIISEVVVFGPGDIARAHCENEHITLQELTDGVEAMAAILVELGG